jgi:hypothetical protein
VSAQVFAVFYFFGRVAASIGPWGPVDAETMAACEHARVEQNERILDAFRARAVGDPFWIVDGRALTPSDIAVACEARDIAPALGERRQ